MGNIPPFSDLLLSRRRGVVVPRILALDPGETTGWSFWQGALLLHQAYGQIHDTDVDSHALQINRLIRTWQPEVLVVEDYRVYSWKKEEHTWASLHTPRLIGAIQFMAKLEKLPPPVMQMAHQAKTFVTDDKLKAWHYWIKGQRHSRDSIRHALFYILFGKFPNENVPVLG